MFMSIKQPQHVLIVEIVQPGPMLIEQLTMVVMMLIQDVMHHIRADQKHLILQLKQQQ